MKVSHSSASGFDTKENAVQNNKSLLSCKLLIDWRLTMFFLLLSILQKHYLYGMIVRES